MTLSDRKMHPLTGLPSNDYLLLLTATISGLKLNDAEQKKLIQAIGDYARSIYAEPSPDANVEKNRQMLLDRSKVGLQKYGVTTERTDLSIVQWLHHALEESLDLSNYLQATISQIKREGISTIPARALDVARQQPGAYTYSINFTILHDGHLRVDNDGLKKQGWGA